VALRPSLLPFEVAIRDRLQFAQGARLFDDLLVAVDELERLKLCIGCARYDGGLN